MIVVNDNERSYAPTIGGLANHLATLRTTDGYERFLARGKDLLGRTPSSASRCTRPCTAPRRALRTSSPRRSCSRTWA
ncbi:1-deoxy-D-xylulose-5-phosphate synthase N-terminal domain-containing protein [Streptomyces sp. M19]